MDENNATNNLNDFLYQLKASLMTETEKKYFSAIIPLLPNGYILQPQINLASIIERTDNFKFCNELYRNIDVGIFDFNYKPIALIEINDSSHNSQSRYERDKKVSDICEEAGITVIKFWTKYGINPEYMQKKIFEAIEHSKQPTRVKHFNIQQTEAPVLQQAQIDNQHSQSSKKSGCYIATCVYGSYDCPQVWTLRRFRDYVLTKSVLGRAFIKVYYALSPMLVSLFGKTKVFKIFWMKLLDKMVTRLNKKGMSDKAYYD